MQSQARGRVAEGTCPHPRGCRGAPRKDQPGGSRLPTLHRGAASRQVGPDASNGPVGAWMEAALRPHLQMLRPSISQPGLRSCLPRLHARPPHPATQPQMCEKTERHHLVPLESQTAGSLGKHKDGGLLDRKALAPSLPVPEVRGQRSGGHAHR